MKLFVSCPRFVEDLLNSELSELGITVEKEIQGGVYAPFSNKNVYKICMYSRIANKVLAQLKSVPAGTPEILTSAVSEIGWEEHFGANESFAVYCGETNEVFRNAKYASQVVKDGVIKRFQELRLGRPKVDTTNPDMLIHVFLHGKDAEISLNLSGASLHERNYRLKQGAAPLRENIAAALLYRAGWKYGDKRVFFDPMCGSGTILIEAAGIAGGLPPGLTRKSFGFEKWKYHKAFEYRSVRQEAQEKLLKGMQSLPIIAGMDIDRKAVMAAYDNIKSCGLSGTIEVFQGDARNMENAAAEFNKGDGLIAFNPPYGERMGDKEQLSADYGRIGTQIKKYFPGWKASFITSSRYLAFGIGMKAYKRNKLYNGGLLTYAYHFEIMQKIEAAAELPPGGDMFKNRLIKKRRLLKKYLNKNEISCFRLYDADMPEYAASVDVFEDKWLYLQEYEAPKSVGEYPALKRLSHIMAVLPEFFSISPENIFYSKLDNKPKYRYSPSQIKENKRIVRENGLKYFVSFEHYPDPGLELGQRGIREYIKNSAKGVRFLNLFSYTGAPGLCAAAGGAQETLSVDSNNYYLNWTGDNFKLNGFLNESNKRLSKDAFSFLANCGKKFDLIYIDPPFYSGNKTTGKPFALLNDYPRLITLALKVCAPGGKILFVTNQKKLRFKTDEFRDCSIKEITNETLQEDFKSSKYKYRCWEIIKD